MIAGVQVKYADRQKFSNTGYGYQYNEGGKVTVDYRIMKMMIESNFDYYGMGTTRDRFAAFYFNADYGFDSRYIFSGTVRYDGTNAWEAIVVPVGYRLGMLVPNGISVMNISWNLPNGSINCRCVDLMA